MRRTGKRAAAAAAIAACVLGILWVVAHSFLNRPAFLARIDREAASRLESAAPNVRAEIAPLAGISWLGCVEIPFVRASFEVGGRPFESAATGISLCPSVTSLALGRLGLRSATVQEVTIERKGAGPGKARGRVARALSLLGGAALSLGQSKQKDASRPALDFQLRLGVLRLPGIPVLEKAGPFSIAGRLAASFERVEYRGVAGAGSRVDTWVRFDRAAAEVSAEASVTASPLSGLPFKGAGAVFEKGTVTARVHVEGRLLEGSAQATVEGSVDGLVAHSTRLAGEPVGPVNASWKGEARYEILSGKIELRPSTVTVNGITARLSAEIQLERERQLRAEVDMGPIEYLAAVQALPLALQPPASDLFADGPLTFHGNLTAPLGDPERWTTSIALDLSKVKRLPGSTFDPSGPFLFHPPPGAGGEVPAPFEVGPGNPGFVPLGAIPPVLVRAVLLAEDFSFYGHRGFDFQEMALAIGRNLRAGKPVRGASTITQQLAKNLFLDREKTYARKVKEAILALELEATLSKSRILEVYLNVIEWGPGIRGIGAASRHYFGKGPSDLSPKEAAFLAAIIPNPIRYHLYYDRGALTENWEERVRALLAKLLSTGAISQEECDRAVAEPLVFARG